MSVVIETTIGDITVDLYTEYRPQACLNFLKLCKLKYYNFNLFHNIERNFIAQTGDPTGVGDGGESIWGVIEGKDKRFFEAENLPKIKHEIPGLLSLVSIGKNMVGSQFFFTMGANLISLDNLHCVIGEVVEGHDVLRKLNEAIVDEKFRPYQDIRITHTVILNDPFEDPRGFKEPSRSPSPTPERLKNGRIAADEEINDTEGKSMEEIQEMLAQREANARATILEIVGDLPDADIAPPENVLFVCKLNPVTNEDDLEIIFSRFGKVKSCEVIKDKVSGDSLQYAFVEFENKKDCEQAYFKMDNVLIDDRRIHVDFSQSVSRIQWRGKGKGLIHKDGSDNRKLDFNKYKDKVSSQKHSTSNKKYQNKYPEDKESNTRRYDDRNKNFNDADDRRLNVRRYDDRRNFNDERYNKDRNYSRYNERFSDRKNDDTRNFNRNDSRKVRKSKYSDSDSEAYSSRKELKKKVQSDSEDDHTSKKKKHKKEKKKKNKSKSKKRSKEDSNSSDSSGYKKHKKKKKKSYSSSSDS